MYYSLKGTALAIFVIFTVFIEAKTEGDREKDKESVWDRWEVLN